jgi:hypothetical protein
MTKLLSITFYTLFILFMIYVGYKADTTGGQWMGAVMALVGVSKVLDHKRQ